MNPSTFRLAKEIKAYCSILLKLIGKDRDQRLAELIPGMTGIQYGVLSILHSHPYMLREVSIYMHLAASTLVPVIDRLENEGWLRRVQDQKDRRRNMLMITDAGYQIIQKCRHIEQDDLFTRHLQNLRSDQVFLLHDLLGQLVADMSEDPHLLSEIALNIGNQFSDVESKK